MPELEQKKIDQYEEIKKIASLRIKDMICEQDKWIDAWRDIRDFICPYMGKFRDEYVERGKRPDSYIMDSVSLRTLRVLPAGFQSGMTSPSKRWLRFIATDPALNKVPSVRQWLDYVTDKILEVLRVSNFYNTTLDVYKEISLFGNACVLTDEDDESVIRFRCLTCGEFMLGNDSTLRVDSVARTMKTRAYNMVQQFGKDNVPSNVLRAYENSEFAGEHEVYHLIMPNTFFNDKALGWRGKKFVSIYWVPGGSVDDNQILQLSGYDVQPFAAPRWQLVSDNIYGYSPGWEILGDCMQLHKEVENKQIQLELLINPPLNVSEGVRGVDSLPGGVNYVPGIGQQPAGPVFNVVPQLQALGEDIQQLHQAIKEGFYEQLFLAVILGGQRQMTAREIVERHEEKLMMLGPVIERVQNEFLKPVINRIYDLLWKRGMLPETPPELSKVPVSIEYLGIFAQAQKMNDSQTLPEVLNFLALSANFSPESADNINFDKALLKFSESMGVPADIMRTSEEVADIRDARAQAQQEALQQQQQQQQMSQATELSKVIKDVGGVKPENLQSLQQAVGGSIGGI